MKVNEAMLSRNLCGEALVLHVQTARIREEKYVLAEGGWNGMAKRRKSTFERLKTGRMNRAERRDLGRRIAASDPKLAIVHVNAAGEVRFGITSGQDAAD